MLRSIPPRSLAQALPRAARGCSQVLPSPPRSTCARTLRAGLARSRHVGLSSDPPLIMPGSRPARGSGIGGRRPLLAFEPAVDVDRVVDHLRADLDVTRAAAREAQFVERRLSARHIFGGLLGIETGHRIIALCCAVIAAVA